LKPGEAYKAVNAVVQGSCASIFKKALVQVYNSLGRDEHVVLVVHDEIQIEIKAGRNKGLNRGFVKRVVENMQDIEELEDRGLVLKVGVDRTETNWAEKKAV
jgi:DNA polymerase I-like protein with 3'-5' exonuclease and polymerase domains